MSNIRKDQLNLVTPTANNDPATKSYVDSVASGGGGSGLAAVLAVSNTTDGYSISLGDGADIVFEANATTPFIRQITETTPSATGEILTIQAQNVTGSNGQGGNLELYAGEGDGYGGALVMEGGIGAITGGSVFIRSGAGTNAGATSGNITLDVANSNSGTNGEIRLAIDTSNKITIGQHITIANDIEIKTNDHNEEDDKFFVIRVGNSTNANARGGSISLVAGNGPDLGGDVNLFTGTGGEFGGGVYFYLGVTSNPQFSFVNGMFMRNITAASVSTSTSGGTLFVEAGSLKFKDATGTVTTIAP